MKISTLLEGCEFLEATFLLRFSFARCKSGPVWGSGHPSPGLGEQALPALHLPHYLPLAADCLLSIAQGSFAL